MIHSMTKKTTTTRGIGKRCAVGTRMAIKGNIYVSGPINGNPNYKAAFGSAAAELRRDGWTVYSPTDLDVAGMSLREMLGIECGYICREATAIYMLKGWEHSSGAQAEWALARALGLRIFYE
jgi:hypothetical protein